MVVVQELYVKVITLIFLAHLVSEDMHLELILETAIFGGVLRHNHFANRVAGRKQVAVQVVFIRLVMVAIGLELLVHQVQEVVQRKSLLVCRKIK